LHGYVDTRLQRYWGHNLDLLGSIDVIGRMIIGSAYPILAPNQKLIQCLVAEIYPSEDGICVHPSLAHSHTEQQ